MYVTYETDQVAFGKRPAVTASEYRPERVIRVSDMTVVPGSEAVDGYCALSYSWTWGGERVVLADGRQDVKDEGHHVVVTQDGQKHVHFEGCLQQLCKDFGIDYLWYDRQCVNIGDATEKIQSLRNMYNTYSNALFTVALVPEMAALDRVSDTKTLAQCLDQILESEWCQRVWLLAEAMISKKILFVGKDVHIWSTALDQYDAGESLEAVQALSAEGAKDASKVLWHVHRRSTAIEHDRVLALINIYSGLVHMEITYDINMKDHMLQFYSQLAKNDLTILCFGKQQHVSTIDKHTFLPSWTGINGTHIQHASLTQLELPPLFEPYTVEGGEMFLCCDGVTISIEPWTEQRYGLTFTHAVPRKVFLSLTDDACQECTVLDVPFHWKDCTIRPVVRKEGDDFVAIGVSCIPNRESVKVSLDEFGTVSNSSFVIK
ncbi:hypothetical protein BJV82DRAFT_625466 [Fennellomyces sp. T-0311]|nr:hypothetical protein BJV82DRAFT_625466 [Fennellomyces sp. T-0311]